MVKRLFLCLAIFTIIITGCQHVEEKHPSGRDTVKSFGDGTFQLQRKGSSKTIVLYDLSKSPPYSAIDTIKAYKTKKNTAYLIGMKYYIFVDIAKNVVTLYESIDQVPSEYRAIFESLELKR